VLSCDLVAGVVLEVADVAATRAFYEPIFRDARGEWDQRDDALIFRRGPQHVDFVQRPDPHTLGDSGQHTAYRVPRGRLRDLVQELQAAGHEARWWHEDQPSEREETAYLQDPSGNRVQLVESDNPDFLLDHFVYEVHDLEPEDVYYVSVLGGSIDYYHGRSMYHYAEGKEWGEGRDPSAAPWTRFWPGPSSIAEAARGKGKTSHPALQIYIRFGPTHLGLVLGTTHRQEPPEEQVAGTPRVLLRARHTVNDAMVALRNPGVSLDPEARIRLPFEQRGSSLLLRDPTGHFVELECGV
jgi:catechol 2,3-dioxygenase-like lactoylglutathione lyase family enzyme